MRPIESREETQVIQASLFAAECLSPPHCAPAVFGYKILEISVKLVRILDSVVYIGVA
jgi:hypothetical protein